MKLKELLKSAEQFQMINIKLLNAEIFTGTIADLNISDNFKGLKELDVLKHKFEIYESENDDVVVYNILLNYKITFNSKKHEVYVFDIENIDEYKDYVKEIIEREGEAS